VPFFWAAKVMKTESIIGFHGTTKDRGRKILDELTWELSDNDYDWLGRGVYLFQDSPLHALRFAEKRAAENRDNGNSGDAIEPFVLRVKLNLLNCIDLTDSDWMPALRVQQGRFNLKRAAEGLDIPVQLPFVANPIPNRRTHLIPGRSRGAMREDTKHYLDCAVMRFFVNDFPSADRPHSIRAAFVDGYPIYTTSWLFDLSHVQVCVLEPSIAISEPEEVLILGLQQKRQEANRRASLLALTPVT
jgi:hypothetical protein